MTKPQVIITDFIQPPLDCEQRILADVAEVTALNVMHPCELEGKIEHADALMMYHFASLGRETINRLKNCRLIVRCGVGTDNVDLQAAYEKGIPVANVPDYGTEEVADSAIGMMLSLARGIHLLNQKLRQSVNQWSYNLAKPLARLRGKTFGIVGLGRIGVATALRAKALGMEVVFYDPYIPDGCDKAFGVRRANQLADLLQNSYVLSIHCPLTEQTHHLVNEEVLNQLPRGAYLVNTARGGVVDSAAVLGAIESGRLAGAGLDVLETEPPPETDPLIRAWRDPGHPASCRVIINPHAAFYSEQGLEDMRAKGSENCRRVLLGQPPRNVVNGVV